MLRERWRRGESRERLLRAALRGMAEVGPGAVSGRRVAAEAGVHHPQIQQMFGSVDELVSSAVIAERDRFAGEAFGEGDDLPSPLLISQYPSLWQAVTQVLLDPGPVSLARLADGGPVEVLAARLQARGPARSPDVVAAIASSWFAAPAGALIFREPLRRGFGISAEEWDWCWEHLGRRIARLGDEGDLPVADARPSTRARSQPAVGERGRERLLHAAEDLLACRLETTVTGRELAEAAGVNYGLVNHYFGSKGAVFDAALSNLHRRFLDDVLELEGADASGRSFAVFADHNGFLRAWASRLIREADTPEFELLGMQRLMDRVIRARKITDRRSPRGKAAVGDAMTSVALQLGWAILRPLPMATGARSLAGIEGALASIHRWMLEDNAAERS
ncbi:MAG: TetR family transcriptional regulator [Acidimicrobiales bacterium]